MRYSFADELLAEKCSFDSEQFEKLTCNFGFTERDKEPTVNKPKIRIKKLPLESYDKSWVLLIFAKIN